MASGNDGQAAEPVGTSVEPRPCCVEFGIYVADLRSGELREEGQPVPLQRQPFAVLSGFLLRALGDLGPPAERGVVTRDELRRLIWPERAADEVSPWEDASINMAIKKVRDALGAEMIETVRGYGYRYLGPPPRVPGKEANETARKSTIGAGQVTREPASRPPRPLQLLILGGSLVVLTLASAWLVASRSRGQPVRSGQPAVARKEATSLAIVDQEERLLWRFPVEKAAAGTDWDARMRDPQGDIVRIEDIDGNGRTEVLVVVEPPLSSGESSQLHCLEFDGEDRWTVEVGRNVKFRERYFLQPYRAGIVGSVHLGGRPMVAVNARHNPLFPSQILLLDALTGETRLEYWHPGNPASFLFHDLDGDGHPEFLIGGVNNPDEGLGHPFLAILEYPGDGDSTPGLLGFPEPNLRQYVLLPLPDTYQVTEEKAFVNQMRPHPSGGISVRIGLPAGVLLDLSRDLEVIRMTVADDLKRHHNELFRAGVLDHELSEAEMDSWRRILLLEATPDGNSQAIRDRLEPASGWPGR